MCIELAGTQWRFIFVLLFTVHLCAIDTRFNKCNLLTSSLLWFACVWRTKLRRTWATTALDPLIAVSRHLYDQPASIIPRCRRITFGRLAFSVEGPTVWNSVTTDWVWILPLLPPADIVDALADVQTVNVASPLVTSCRPTAAADQLRTAPLNSEQHHWTRQTQCPSRTNNVLENYHAALRRHQNMYAFLAYIQQQATADQLNDVACISNGLQIRRPKRKWTTNASRLASQDTTTGHTVRVFPDRIIGFLWGGIEFIMDRKRLSIHRNFLCTFSLFCACANFRWHFNKRWIVECNIFKF